MSRIGEKIKTVRTEKGITQKQLSKKLGVSESFINEIEQGRKIINEALINRLSKVLGKELNEEVAPIEEKVEKETKREFYTQKVKNIASAKKEQVSEVWSNAFASVLKSVPVYNYNMDKAVYFKEIPIKSNKVEGYAQDKVFYIQIQDDDMLGFRMAKGDIVFGHVTNEIQSNGIYFIEVNGERKVRQIKRLDNTKLLLISNRETLRTQTVNVKEIKVVGKLERVEITLG